MSELINNSEFRKKKLQELIRSLHEGKSIDEVKDEFKKHFGDVSTTEISQIEQALVKEGLPIEEVQRLCDVHASVFKGSIADIHTTKDYSKILGHPVNVFIEENNALEKLINEEIMPHFEKFKSHRGNMPILMMRIGFEKLQELNIHYGRKEYLFFPYLEKHAITAPPKVMWGVDDEIRADIKDVNHILSKPIEDEVKLIEKIETTLKKILDMIFKENNILVPLLSETLSFYEWIKIDEESPEFGYAFVKPTRSWKVEKVEEPEQPIKTETPNEVMFDAGHLFPEEINAILNTLPLDLTFVDKENKVKYFTQGKERIFERPKTIIGRDVNLCHPPASVHVVEKIIESFQDGTKDHEDFWIKMKGMYVYIRYFAVRDKNGNYLGTLEVTQDIKEIKDLSGEKRLLSE